MSKMRKPAPMARNVACEACHGKLNRSVLTIPVPIVTENQDGVNRMILDRSPRAFAANMGCVDMELLRGGAEVAAVGEG